jgi:response regulator RpfG family c-di-GMP phosphodiesterase
VLEYIVSQKGKHFVPEVVDAFMSILDTIRQISESTPRSD